MMNLVHCVSSVGWLLFLYEKFVKKRGIGFDIMTIFYSISAGHFLVNFYNMSSESSLYSGNLV